MSTEQTHAFTLVELSIVLVILGLLTGGILTGQSLIRAAELRSVTTELHRYQTATQTFRDKYMAIPGDMNTATKFWGDDNAACPDAAVTNGTPGTCNGDNNGTITTSASAGATGERFEFWRQLALAGLIEGSYTGLAGPVGTTDHVVGTNAPASKYPSGLWSANTNGIVTGNANQFDRKHASNTFVLGKRDPTDGGANEPLLKPEEAWNIDAKLDDGKPGTGRITARYWNNLCATASSSADIAADYNLTSTIAQCAFYITY